MEAGTRCDGHVCVWGGMHAATTQGRRPNLGERMITAAAGAVHQLQRQLASALTTLSHPLNPHRLYWGRPCSLYPPCADPSYPGCTGAGPALPALDAGLQRLDQVGIVCPKLSWCPAYTLAVSHVSIPICILQQFDLILPALNHTPTCPGKPVAVCCRCIWLPASQPVQHRLQLPKISCALFSLLFLHSEGPAARALSRSWLNASTPCFASRTQEGMWPQP